MNTRYRNRTAPTRTQLSVEALEERSLLSASPLTWTAPAVGHTPNQIDVTVSNGRIEIFDNGQLAAGQNVADTSAITINTNPHVANEVLIIATPAGVPTTVNLKGLDLVLIGDTSGGQGGNGNPRLSATSLTPGSGLVHDLTPPSTVPSGTMANILGDVTINGAARDVVELADRLDDATGHVAISASTVAGLAPGMIHLRGIGTLAIDGKGKGFLGTAYTVSSASGHVYLALHGVKDSVSISSTSGWVNVDTSSPLATVSVVGAATGTNTLTGSTGTVSLSGAAYHDTIAGFGTIAVSNRSPQGVAKLQTVSTGTSVTADPNDLTLTAGNQQLTAVGFHNATVTSSDPAADFADVTGPTTGTNRLSAGPGSLSFFGAGYHLDLYGFANTTTFSKSASDKALLLGDLGGGNTLYAWPGHVYMATNGGYRNDAEGFASVVAVGAAKPDDSAYLYGSQSGATLSARPNDVTLTAGGYRTEVGNMATVNVDAESASSVADVRGKALDATPSMAVLDVGQDEGVKASGFAKVIEHITAQTYALTSDGTLLRQTHVNGPKATVMMHAFIGGGGSLFGWTTVDTGVTDALVGNLVNHNYLWDQDGSGVRVFAPSVASAATNIALTLSDLSDTQLQTTVLHDMVRDGGLSYNGMLDAFNTVEVEDIFLSAGQLADLRLLVQCATTLKMPADVASLADSVVNGQQSNADFHTLDANGLVQSWHVGDMQAGSRTTDLLSLVEKWFLGVNEPFADSAYVQISGGLFKSPASGPSFLDVSQGQVGDCWLLADFEEVAIKQPSAIRSMFVHEGTNTVNGDTVDVYAVRFFSNGVPHYITVDTFFPVAANGENGRTLQYADDVTGALWPALLEKAYAEAAAAGWVKIEHSPSNAYAVLQGGWPSYATPAVINQTSPQHDIDFNAAVAAFRAGKVVILDTGGSPADPNIVHDHAYPVQGYDAATHSLILVNPWGVMPDNSARTGIPGTTVYGRFEASASMVKDNFSKMSISGSAPAPDPAGGLTSRAPSVDLAALLAVLSDRHHG